MGFRPALLNHQQVAQACHRRLEIGPELECAPKLGLGGIHVGGVLRCPRKVIGNFRVAGIERGCAPQQLHGFPQVTVTFLDESE